MTANHVQGVFGEFVAVLDIAGGSLTANQEQGVFGEFKPVLDVAQTAGAPAAGDNRSTKMQPGFFWGPI